MIKLNFERYYIKSRKRFKQYRLGQVGMGSLSHDLNRWWHQVRGRRSVFTNWRFKRPRYQGRKRLCVGAADINFEVKRGEVLNCGKMVRENRPY
jgi:lipopolysaccharide transport system ATP-binding protein